MTLTRVKVENVSKQYRLGLVGSTTLREDINRFWHKIRGKPDPTLKIGEENKLDQAAQSHIWALQDINLEVKEGEVLGIIGKNGAGKSTLLKLLSRVTSPTMGEIKVKGRIASLLEVGTGMHPELTGRENIFLNGAILGMTRPEIRAKLDEIVDFAGIEKYIDTPVKRYSSGMRVRLGFAVAAHLEPEILIVDEVLAVGDAEFQKKAIGKMQDVSKGEGRTVLFVSHNMASVEQLCTRSALIHEGRITKIGNTYEIINHYIESSFNDTTKTLNNRTDRKGTSFIFFYNYVLLNNEQKETDTLITGKDAYFKLYYKARASIDFNKVNLSVGIRNSKQTFLFNCPSNIFQYRDKLKKNGSVTLKIPRLPLPEGDYTFNIFSEANGDISDWIANAGKFSVLSGDFYKTGKKTPISHKGVLVDYKWFVE